MNVSGPSALMSRPASRLADTGGPASAKGTNGPSPSGAADEFLKYATMSPMERMRANILKGMDLTEDQLGALPQEERQKIEDKIKDSIKKLAEESGQRGQLVDISA